MSTATTNGASARTSEARQAAAGTTTRVRTLDELVGAHPEALRAIFGSGHATDPVELGAQTRGLFLAIEPTREIHFLVRPVLHALASGAMPWRGKAFEMDGTGVNLVLGRPMVPFAYETGPSDVDGAPALVIRYDRPEHRNAWPIRNIRDELRTIADGLAIGPALFSATANGERKVLAWFGLQRA